MNKDIYFNSKPLMIVETSDNQLYSVFESDDLNLAHCWMGTPVKATKRDGYVLKGKRRVQLVRKAASRIVMAPVADPFARIA